MFNGRFDVEKINDIEESAQLEEADKGKIDTKTEGQYDELFADEYDDANESNSKNFLDEGTKGDVEKDNADEINFEDDEKNGTIVNVDDIFADEYNDIDLSDKVEIKDSSIEGIVDEANENMGKYDSFVQHETQVDTGEKYSPNTKVKDSEGNTYITDDEGNIFKENGELLPNKTYILNGNEYTTDELGRIKTVDATPESTPEGTRDSKAQREVGGEDRQENDQGGHLLARIFGGEKGVENLEAMRDILNQGPYKQMENRIKKALDENKNVEMHTDVEYEGDSKRPSKITTTYTIDDKKYVEEFDNEKGSTELLNSLESKISENDYNDIKNDINAAEKDGQEMSVLNVRTEYDENGNANKVVVIMRNETTGETERRTLDVKE